MRPGAVFSDILVQQELSHEAVLGHGTSCRNSRDFAVAQAAAPKSNLSNAAHEKALKVPGADPHRRVARRRGYPFRGIVIVAFRVAGAGVPVASLEKPVLVNGGPLGIRDTRHVNPIPGHQVFVVEVTSDPFSSGRVEYIEADPVVALFIVALVVDSEGPLLSIALSFSHPMNVARTLGTGKRVYRWVDPGRDRQGPGCCQTEFWTAWDFGAGRKPIALKEVRTDRWHYRSSHREITLESEI